MVNLTLPKSVILILMVILSFFIPQTTYSQNYPPSDYDPHRRNPIAFPGAEGYGKYASGGRGGQVLKVTNLNDSGPGSLRAAIEARGPRIVIFEVSGNIKLNSDLTITNGNITIAGQTAPGDGITLQNFAFKVLNTENVIIRYIRSRHGDLAKVEGDSFDARGVKNMIVDHCSFTWGVDETCTIYDVENTTLQYSIIAEGLNNSVHSKGPHGYGSLMGGNRFSIVNNLWSHFLIRMPSLTSGTIPSHLDQRNNLFYNWVTRSTDNASRVNANLVSNFYKPGPATAVTGGITPQNFLWPTADGNDHTSYGKFFLQGNKLQGRSAVDNDQWKGVRLENADLTNQYLESLKNKDQNGNPIPFVIPNEIYSLTRNADQSYQNVLSNVGANLFRDAVDQRIINEVLTGSFTYRGSKTRLMGIIDSQNDVGGWPTLKSLATPLDSDQDGMPDTWEISNDLNPNRSNDSEYNLSPYFTDIEVYLNSLVDNLVKNQYPDAPLPVTPRLPSANASNVAPVDITFAWDLVPNADSYQVQISKSATFSSGNITLNDLKNLSVIYPQLDSNSTYYWRVRGVRNGVSGAYSAARSFQTNTVSAVPGQPILLAPSSSEDSVDLSPILIWSKVPNAQTYDIQISTLSNFSSTVLNLNGILETSFQTPKLLGNQKYFWRVRARNSNGSGTYSLVGTFTTASTTIKTQAVVPIRPTNGVIINPVNIRLEWKPVPGAESYRVQVSTVSNFSSNVVFRDGLETPFLDIPNLNSNTQYYWRVIGFNQAGLGVFPTAPNVFKTGPFTQAPKVIELSNPVDDSNIFSTSIAFSWAKDPIASTYTFQLSTREDFGTFIVNVNNLTGTSRTVSNLQANTQYFWRVWATNEAGPGPVSEVRKVRSATANTTPAATTLIVPTNNAVVGNSNIEFRWQNQPNAEFYRLEVSEFTNFSSLVFSRNSIRGTSWLVPALAANKTYYWRVRTSNSRGNGPYSSVSSFKTASNDVNLNQPTLSAPSNAALNLSKNLNLSWNPVQNATGYDIQISENNTFSTLVFEQMITTGTSTAATGLSDAKTYFWRVRAKSGSVNSNWSEVWNFSTLGQTNITPIQVGVVGYWPMEEGGGNKIIDLSGFSNTGTLRTTENVAWVSGKEGQALSLNGWSNRFADVPHSQSLVLPNALSISAWVKPNLLHRGTILSKSAGNGFEFWLDSNGQLEFRLNREKNGSTYRLRSNYKYTAGQWFHAAATFDGTTMKIYVNGNLDTSATFNPFTIGTSSGNLVLGAMGTNQRMNGAMDEVRLHNRALSLEEIQLLVQDPLINQSPPQELIGHWKMDEGSGDRFIDDSGNGNHARIANTSGITWSEAKVGLGVNLSGFADRYGVIEHNSSLEFAEALTISAWVKPNELNRGTIVSKSAGNGFELWIDIDGFIEFRLNRTNSGATYRLRSNFNYIGDIGKWIHVTATFDGQTSKIYINGVEDANMRYPAAFSIRTTSGQLFIGSMGTIQRMNGSLDDLRIYAKALSPTEVINLVNFNNFRVMENSISESNAPILHIPTNTVDVSLDRSSKESIGKPTLFPNPVGTIIQIRSLWIDNGRVILSLFDLNGRTLLIRDVEVYDSKLEIGIADLNLSPGNYICIIQDNFERAVLRFIKK